MKELTKRMYEEVIDPMGLVSFEDEREEYFNLVDAFWIAQHKGLFKRQGIVLTQSEKGTWLILDYFRDFGDRILYAEDSIEEVICTAILDIYGVKK